MAHSGDNAYGTDLDGPLGGGVTASLRSFEIDLTTVGHSALSFWYNVNIPQGEGGVQLSVLDEANQPLHVWEEEIFMGQSEGWTQWTRSMPVSARGKKVVLEWKLLTEGGEPNGAGFFLDDVMID